jgi:hypothetical protein
MDVLSPWWERMEERGIKSGSPSPIQGEGIFSTLVLGLSLIL